MEDFLGVVSIASAFLLTDPWSVVVVEAALLVVLLEDCGFAVEVVDVAATTGVFLLVCSVCWIVDNEDGVASFVEGCLVVSLASNALKKI